MKKFIVGLVAGAAISIGLTAFALPVQTSQTIQLIAPKLTETEQIRMGNAFNIYTGEKLEADPVELSPVEMRLRAIESRLSRLEARQ